MQMRTMTSIPVPGPDPTEMETRKAGTPLLLFAAAVGRLQGSGLAAGWALWKSGAGRRRRSSRPQEAGWNLGR